MGTNYHAIPLTDEQTLTDTLAREFLQSPEDEAEDSTQGRLADAIRNQQVPAWLASFGIDYASLPKNSRYPTRQEILGAIKKASVLGCSMHPDDKESFKSLVINDEYLTGRVSTLLTVQPLNSSTGEVEVLWFNKGNAWIILYTVQNIVTLCGPFIVIPDDNQMPYLVQESDDDFTYHQAWRKTRR